MTLWVIMIAYASTSYQPAKLWRLSTFWFLCNFKHQHTEGTAHLYNRNVATLPSQNEQSPDNEIIIFLLFSFKKTVHLNDKHTEAETKKQSS